MSKSVLLIDHHDSTIGTLNNNLSLLRETYAYKFSTYINTSVSESAATLTWRLTHGDKIPDFVQIVRIGDTWQWHDYPHLHAKSVLKSLKINRAFRSFIDIEETFVNWNKNVKTYIQRGNVINDYETALVKKIAKQCSIGFIQTNDDKVYTIAYTQANILHSDIGVVIRFYAERRFGVHIHFCCTWKYVPHRKIVSVSLRDGGDLNLWEIAQTIKGSNGKGAGHRAASSFAFEGIENFHNFILSSNPLYKH